MLYPLSYERWEIKILTAPREPPREVKGAGRSRINPKLQVYGL
jgi:hypothetical protein